TQTLFSPNILKVLFLFLPCMGDTKNLKSPISFMSKTFNFYCDESCHLENDGMPYMLIAYVSSAYNQVKLHQTNIKALREKHRCFGEIKWTKVSKSQAQF